MLTRWLAQDDLLSLVASISGAVEAKTANKLKKIVRSARLRSCVETKSLIRVFQTPQRKPKSETVEKEQKEERQSKKKQQLVHRSCRVGAFARG